MSQPNDLRDRLKRIEQVLARVAVGDLEQSITLREEEDLLSSLELGINFLILDLKASAKRNAEKEAELREKLDLIESQNAAIRELSTPVTEVWEGILVLPLIGIIDKNRAVQIVEQLLDAIVSTQASIAIIDIVGVPLVDASVADHLLQTVDAAKLLGTTVILTGVSPENAQTMVKLGIDLSAVTTKSSLRAGLALAFELTNRKVKDTHIS